MIRARPWLIWIGFVLAASSAYKWYDGRGGLWMARTYATSELFHPTMVGAFETLELCRTAAETDLSRRGFANTGRYTCGRKCEWRRQGFYWCVEERTSPPRQRPPRQEPIRPAPAVAG